MTPSESRWICLKETPIFETSVMNLVQQDCRSSDSGREHRFYLLRSPDWCNIIPVTEEGNVVLVRQFRIGINAHTLEVPGGTVDAGDGEDFQAAALREMEEETGYSPLPGARLVKLGWVHPNPAILDNKTHLFAVGPVRRTQAQDLDPGEMIETVEVPLEELPTLIENETITHALTLNSLFRLILATPEGSAGLSRALKNFTG